MYVYTHTHTSTYLHTQTHTHINTLSKTWTWRVAQAGRMAHGCRRVTFRLHGPWVYLWASSPRTLWRSWVWPLLGCERVGNGMWGWSGFSRGGVLGGKWLCMCAIVEGTKAAFGCRTWYCEQRVFSDPCPWLKDWDPQPKVNLALVWPLAKPAFSLTSAHYTHTGNTKANGRGKTSQGASDG